MSYKLVVKILAERDISEAAEWYSKQANHLAGQFIEKIETAFKELQKNPEHYQKRYNDVRVLFAENFPFGIYYTIEDNTIFIHAVLHTRRNPKTGTGRI